MTIEWSYMRRGCISCEKAKALIAAKKIRIAAEVDCKKSPLDASALLDLLSNLESVVVTKGKKVLQLSAQTDQNEILAVAIGRSGNLRAPSLRNGKTLLVGYVDEAYSELLEQLALVQ